MLTNFKLCFDNVKQYHYFLEKINKITSTFIIKIICHYELITPVVCFINKL